jgi:hypothetical protein
MNTDKYKLYYLYDNKKEEIIEFDSDIIMDGLYNLEIKLPTEDQLKKYKKKDKLGKFMENKTNEETREYIRISISKLENKVALYDAYSDNLYVINRDLVYYRVIYHSYRFPTREFIKNLEKKYNILEKKIKDKFYNEKDIILKKRKYRKYEMMFDFMQNFDIDELNNTYIRVFYLYANEVGKNITLCQRPSFMSHFTHIKPYYSRSEVINMAMNMCIKFKDDDVDNLCGKIKENDITAKTLLSHQKYIIKENKVGLVQYYSLHGSYMMNQYLRNMISHPYQNKYLETLITPMWELVNNSPSFDKDYILYRFIQDDGYLRHLDVGEIYIESGFTSATRDPFYRSDLYKFGFVLIKIKVPKDMKGVGLCIETLSHFPHEEEIILPPKTMFRLDKRDSKCEYYHTDAKFVSQVKTRYEFTVIGKGKVEYSKRDIHDGNKMIDFIELDNIETITLEEKIRYFIKNNINELFQFDVKIGNKVFPVITESYDSTGAYKQFYAMTTTNGFSMYTIYNNHVLFFIELLEDKGKKYMHTNYYVQYSTIDRTKIVSDEDFILFLSKVANYFEVDYAVIYADYLTCDILDEKINISTTPFIKERSGLVQRNFAEKDMQFRKTNNIEKSIDENILGGNYCVEYYNYLKHGKKRYYESKILNMELHAKFSYHQLDKLKKTDTYEILNKEDKDELYQIYDKVYTIMNDKNTHNIGDYLVWVIENKCYLVEPLIKKIDRLYKKENTLNKPYYILDPATFLYNKRYITDYPQYIVDKSVDIDRSLLNIPKDDTRVYERD